MNSPLTELNPKTTVLLSTTAHQFARAFAAEQINPQRGKQVYLNTLAVYALHTYLGWARIPTDPESSYSWNPNLRALENRCDLLLPDIGRLECCPVLPNVSTFTPPMLAQDSMAYIAVQFSESLTEVDLLGYLPIVGFEDVPEEVEISDLFPMDQLTDYLFRIQDGLEFIEQNSDDPDVQALLGILEEDRQRSLVEVIIRMEQFRNDEWRWDSDGKSTILPQDVASRPMVSATLSGNAEQPEPLKDDAVNTLAKSLLQKLKAIWEESENALSSYPAEG